MDLQLKYITFNNGEKMPIVGLGTWQATDAEIDAAVDAALEAGYRHIDTAYVYKNEAAIGRALKRWFDSGKLKREDLYVVTKLPMCGLRPELVEKYLKLSLAALQLTYVDLYLIHYPVGVQEVEGSLFPRDKDGNILLDLTTDHVSLWKAMEAQVDAGKTKSIGLSNFNSRQIGRIVAASRIPPANLQVELHVYLQQKQLVDCCAKHGITVCAYSPLGSPGLVSSRSKGNVKTLSPLTEPVVLRIAAQHRKSAAQVLLRYIMQRGIAVIPKSTNPTRVKENLDVYGFQLSAQDMEAIAALDKGAAGRIVSIGELVNGLAAHPEYPLNDLF